MKTSSQFCMSESVNEGGVLANVSVNAQMLKQQIVSVKLLTTNVNQRSKDQFVQIWSNDVNCSPRGHVYTIMKPNFCLYINKMICSFKRHINKY